MIYGMGTCSLVSDAHVLIFMPKLYLFSAIATLAGIGDVSLKESGHPKKQRRSKPSRNRIDIAAGTL